MHLIKRPSLGLALVLGLVLTLAAAGCGDSRTAPPYVAATAAPNGFSRASFPADGVSFRAPTNWALTSGHPPQIATVHDGLATLAIWRYPRTQPLPVSQAQLRAVLPALLGAVRARDPTFSVIMARPTVFARSPAIELTGLETIAGALRHVRSIHVFHAGAELVLDAFAPPSDFARVDRLAFQPLLHSVHLR
ncbi:MAG TPA: hypothetical protein VGY97_12580 [Solirubrobacteraceae bacterium]|nr:hypothetical protein [Solirubrobacteraceae bacterium]